MNFVRASRSLGQRGSTRRWLLRLWTGRAHCGLHVDDGAAAASLQRHCCCTAVAIRALWPLPTIFGRCVRTDRRLLALAPQVNVGEADRVVVAQDRVLLLGELCTERCGQSVSVCERCFSELLPGHLRGLTLFSRLPRPHPSAQPCRSPSGAQRRATWPGQRSRRGRRQRSRRRWRAWLKEKVRRPTKHRAGWRPAQARPTRAPIASRAMWWPVTPAIAGRERWPSWPIPHRRRGEQEDVDLPPYILPLHLAPPRELSLRLQLIAGIEKAGSRRVHTVSIGFERRCAPARTVSIDPIGRRRPPGFY